MTTPDAKRTAQAWPSTRSLWWIASALLVQRAIYHGAYIVSDPFARVTFSDGELYERAARNVLAHPLLGSEPLYLQGLYAYLLAAGIAPTGSLLGGLVVQLAAAALGLLAFGAAARTCFGPRVGLLSLIVLLSAFDLAFYENKYLSVSLGISACMFVVWAAARAAARPSLLRTTAWGACLGLAVLGRGNLLLALPGCAVGAWLMVRSGPQPRSTKLGTRNVLALLVGCALAVLPMALRNLHVTGELSVFPSHAGGIPFYIGNNPHANGRWNTAGGLLSGQVANERHELIRRLGLNLKAADPHLDAEIGAELYHRAFAFIRADPAGWLGLEARKLWDTLGNHAFVRDYDRLGERELLGLAEPIGLPFGIVLGLGVLGLGLLLKQARDNPTQAPMFCTLVSLLFACLAANLAWFTSAQNRAPLIVPLAFAAGPALEALLQRARNRTPSEGAQYLPRALVWLAALSASQAFYPRSAEQQHPSSTHYYNLANVEEELGQDSAALTHYARASELNPKQPVFWWRRASLAQRLQRWDEARLSLDRMSALSDLPPELARAAQRAQQKLP